MRRPGPDLQPGCPGATASAITILKEPCGETASSALVEAFGGRRIDIPSTVSGRLLDALGPEVTAALVDHFGGCKLDVPSRGHAERIQKSLRLKRDILISGLTAKELAARHGVTSMWVPYQLQRVDRDSDSGVFLNDAYTYGIRARVNAGFGLWQFAYASKEGLNATNYALARSAMQGMRYDGGRIMGVTPNLLVVPPSLEASARALLTAEELAGGGTNVWRNSAELIVSPYLQG